MATIYIYEFHNHIVNDNELKSDLENQHFYIALKFKNLQQPLYNLGWLGVMSLCLYNYKFTTLLMPIYNCNIIISYYIVPCVCFKDKDWRTKRTGQRKRGSFWIPNRHTHLNPVMRRELMDFYRIPTPGRVTWKHVNKPRYQVSRDISTKE